MCDRPDLRALLDQSLLAELPPPLVRHVVRYREEQNRPNWMAFCSILEKYTPWWTGRYTESWQAEIQAYNELFSAYNLKSRLQLAPFALDLPPFEVLPDAFLVDFLSLMMARNGNRAHVINPLLSSAKANVRIAPWERNIGDGRSEYGMEVVRLQSAYPVD